MPICFTVANLELNEENLNKLFLYNKTLSFHKLNCINFHEQEKL